MKKIIISNNQIDPSEVFEGMDLKEGTRRIYVSALKDFIRFMRKRELNKHSYLEYKRYLEKIDSISIATKNMRMVSAKVFLRELYRLGVLGHDITVNVKPFSQSKTHKKDGLNNKEVSILTKRLAKMPSTFTNSRLKALISLMLLQGLRTVEIERLGVSDVSLVDGVVFIQGKGEDDKEPVFLLPRTAKAIEEYLRVSGVRSGSLFGITSRRIFGVVKDQLIALGIKKSPHGFRHYYTTTLLDDYGDARMVQKLTRHKSLSTLQIYDDRRLLRADMNRVEKAFENAIF